VSAGQALLRVEDLRVEFPSEDGVVHAVDGITYQVFPAKTLGQDRLLAHHARTDAPNGRTHIRAHPV
jgi:hypothetical protein